MTIDQLIPNVDTPTGKAGRFQIERFVVTKKEAEFSNLRALLNPQRENRSCAPGHYTRLLCDGDVLMSDTRAEKYDHAKFVSLASGDVLISGLGLGMVANACLLKPEVESVLVVEKEPDVISLVAHHYKLKFGDRFWVVEADVFKWKPCPGNRYDFAWHDIWASICSDNLVEMRSIKRRLKPFCGRQMCWSEDECKRSQRRVKAGYFY